MINFNRLKQLISCDSTRSFLNKLKHLKLRNPFYFDTCKVCIIEWYSENVLRNREIENAKKS